jgi:hypothetical protein
VAVSLSTALVEAAPSEWLELELEGGVELEGVAALFLLTLRCEHSPPANSRPSRCCSSPPPGCCCCWPRLGAAEVSTEEVEEEEGRGAGRKKDWMLRCMHLLSFLLRSPLLSN